jgi:hypothetical protein
VQWAATTFYYLGTWLGTLKAEGVLADWFGWQPRGTYGDIEIMWSSTEEIRTWIRFWRMYNVPLGFGFLTDLAVTLVFLFCIGVSTLWVVLKAYYNLLSFIRDWVSLVLSYNTLCLYKKKSNVPHPQIKQFLWFKNQICL